MTTRAATAKTLTHRYAWTGEEKTMIAFFALGPTLTTVTLALTAGIRPTAAVTLHVVGLAAAAALFRLGSSRKNRSRITAVLDGTRLHVRGGRVKESRGDLAGTRHVITLDRGPETILELTNREGDKLRVPMRIAGHPDLAPLLREHLGREGVVLSTEARALVDAL